MTKLLFAFDSRRIAAKLLQTRSVFKLAVKQTARAVPRVLLAAGRELSGSSSPKVQVW
ncbi:hypothetical protein NB063_03030 [Rhodopirellula sp. ICT_H3.1]|uniref:Uncharacterized protein n=1 Tax=Aporhodopirellula aestuarii TaxID=2950107 RepID=A0ABT0TYD2_9BACT|nr:hypothetical protein [Aporhodopirellula aestuarii]